MDIQQLQARGVSRAHAISILQGNAYRRDMMRSNLKGCKRYYHRNKPQGFTIGSFNYLFGMASRVVVNLKEAETAVNMGEADMYEMFMKFAHSHLQDFNKEMQRINNDQGAN